MSKRWQNKRMTHVMQMSNTRLTFPAAIGFQTAATVSAPDKGVACIPVCANHLSPFIESALAAVAITGTDNVSAPPVNWGDLAKRQPVMVDQMEAIFDAYVVEKVKIRVDFHSNISGGDPNGNVAVGIALKDDSTKLTPNTGLYGELNYTVHRALSPEGNLTLAMTVEPRKFFGIKDATAADSLRVKADGADWKARPANQLWFHVFGQMVGSGTELAAAGYVGCNITLEYTVRWMEQKEIGFSLTV